MPELPEVEHARRDLERWVVGRTVISAEVPKSRVLRGQKPTDIAKALQGRRAISTERRGKHLLLAFDGGIAIHFHLGMSGRFSQGTDHPHARLVLELDDGTAVTFRDARMFGRVQLGTLDELRASLMSELGPDPLLEELGGRDLLSRLERTKRPIKVALMDQALIAGLGNIYAAEVLWLSRVHPDQPAREIDLKTASSLARSVQRVIADSLKDLRETAGTYVQDAGSDNPFRVYGREGERCRRCKKAEIVKTEHGGRSTFHCPRCQIRLAPRVARAKRR